MALLFDLHPVFPPGFWARRNERMGPLPAPPVGRRGPVRVRRDPSPPPAAPPAKRPMTTHGNGVWIRWRRCHPGSVVPGLRVVPATEGPTPFPALSAVLRAVPWDRPAAAEAVATPELVRALALRACREDDVLVAAGDDAPEAMVGRAGRAVLARRCGHPEAPDPQTDRLVGAAARRLADQPAGGLWAVACLSRLAPELLFAVVESDRERPAALFHDGLACCGDEDGVAWTGLADSRVVPPRAAVLLRRSRLAKGGWGFAAVVAGEAWPGSSLVPPGLLGPDPPPFPFDRADAAGGIRVAFVTVPPVHPAPAPDADRSVRCLVVRQAGGSAHDTVLVGGRPLCLTVAAERAVSSLVGAGWRGLAPVPAGRALGALVGGRWSGPGPDGPAPAAAVPAALRAAPDTACLLVDAVTGRARAVAGARDARGVARVRRLVVALVADEALVVVVPDGRAEGGADWAALPRHRPGPWWFGTLALHRACITEAPDGPGWRALL